MKVYQIDYDLRKQRNYDALYERIKSYRTWCRPLESSWMIATDQTAVQIHDHLKGAMDQDDGLLVTRLQGQAAWSGLNQKVSEWLKSQLAACTA